MRDVRSPASSPPALPRRRLAEEQFLNGSPGTYPKSADWISEMRARANTFLIFGITLLMGSSLITARLTLSTVPPSVFVRSRLIFLGSITFITGLSLVIGSQGLRKSRPWARWFLEPYCWLGMIAIPYVLLDSPQYTFSPLFPSAHFSTGVFDWFWMFAVLALAFEGELWLLSTIRSLRRTRQYVISPNSDDWTTSEGGDSGGAQE